MKKKTLKHFLSHQKILLNFLMRPQFFKMKKLPFKVGTDVNTSDNYSVCRNRLKILLNNTFKNKHDLLTKYYHIIKEQAKLYIIEPALSYQLNKTCYLPHRPIIKDDRQSTKIRMLFDASC